MESKWSSLGRPVWLVGEEDQLAVTILPNTELPRSVGSPLVEQLAEQLLSRPNLTRYLAGVRLIPGLGVYDVTLHVGIQVKGRQPIAGQGREAVHRGRNKDIYLVATGDQLKDHLPPLGVALALVGPLHDTGRADELLDSLAGLHFVFTSFPFLRAPFGTNVYRTYKYIKLPLIVIVTPSPRPVVRH